VIVQYIRVWDLLLDFALTETPNHFIWKWTTSGEFSSASAYRALFFGRPPLLGASHLWKTQRLAGCTSSVGLSFMVAVGRPIGFDVMG
jgi:hypothetical protein